MPGTRRHVVVCALGTTCLIDGCCVAAQGNLGSLGGVLGGLGTGLGGLGGAGLGGGLGGGLGTGLAGVGGSASSSSGTAFAGAAAGFGSPVRGPNDPHTLHRSFPYADIAAHLISKPVDKSPEECRRTCIEDPLCAAWEVCAPLGDGCDGCYLIKRAPRRFDERPGWHAEILPGREELGWNEPTLEENMTAESCHEFLLEANGADQSKPFHEPAIMQKYTTCGFMLRDWEKPRETVVAGQHWPTFVVTNFWDPQVSLPAEVEQELTANSKRAPPQVEGGVGVTSQLHASVGTTPWEDHLVKKPRGPHAFILPFYDTNIGHWIKAHGSMNPLQSYEMQSLLQAGDTVIDVGANLGCYTVPFGERVGMRGKVLAFEPFRWLQQLVSANVAANGLSNVWVFPVGLGTQTTQLEARPPQLRFFSSPGGMKVMGQTETMKNEEAMQLYDWDFGPEIISVVSLDDLLITRNPNTALLGAPPVDNVRLIKIDVEGMEKEVIAGARLLVYHFKPIIWTENVAYFQSKGQDTSFLQLMDELEYTCAQAQNAPNDIICTDRHGRGHQIGS
mmetsp:Transcript_25797/g.56103  ORF Transcript_25797/g.56103 Transcript_25797/m.56103 type:complete len:560 (-) Transcript_25797:66-1745(-)